MHSAYQNSVLIMPFSSNDRSLITKIGVLPLIKDCMADLNCSYLLFKQTLCSSALLQCLQGFPNFHKGHFQGGQFIISPGRDIDVDAPSEVDAILLYVAVQ